MSVVTAPVVVTVSGTAFTIDVTAANLLEDRTVKDFTVINTATDEVLPLINFTKDSQTQLSYSGPDVGTNTNLEVRRSTPVLRFQELRFQSKLSSLVLNEEYDRILRRQAEYTTYGVGPAASGLTLEPVNQAYSALWQDDTVRSRTANVLYNQFETLIAKDTSQDTNIANNVTNINLKANIASPSLTGSPQTTLPPLSSNDTRIANTQWVNDQRSFYHCIVSGTFGQNLAADSTYRVLSYNAVVYNPAGMFSGGTATITTPVAGVWELHVYAFITANVASSLRRLILGFEINGSSGGPSSLVSQALSENTPALSTAILNGSHYATFAAGTTIRGVVFAVTSSGNITVTATRLSVRYLGPTQ